jgi:hypothetical protein
LRGEDRLFAGWHHLYAGGIPTDISATMSNVLPTPTGPADEFMRLQHAHLAEVFALTDGEEEARAVFAGLAADTRDAILAAGIEHYLIYHVSPQSAFNFLTRIWEHPRVDPVLVERWRRWEADYPAMLARNPKLELLEKLQWCSETHDASSWPYGWEDVVHEWVASGTLGPPPFDDRMDVVDDEFRASLRRLRSAVDGWLMWSDADFRVVFVKEPRWTQVCSGRQEARGAAMPRSNAAAEGEAGPSLSK